MAINDASALNDIRILHLPTLSWLTPIVSGDIPSPRMRHTATAISDTTILVIGGTNLRDHSVTGVYALDVAFDGLHVHCRRLETTGPRAAHHPISHHTATLLRSPTDGRRKVVVVGGAEYLEEAAVRVAELDLDSLHWTLPITTVPPHENPDLLAPRMLHLAEPYPLNGSPAIWVFGGATVVQGGLRLETMAPAVLDVASWSWTAPPLSDSSFIPPPRQRTGGCMLSPNVLLVTGGHGAEHRPHHDAFVFDFRALAFQPFQISPVVPSASGHTITAGVLLGGYNLHVDRHSLEVVGRLHLLLPGPDDPPLQKVPSPLPVAAAHGPNTAFSKMRGPLEHLSQDPPLLEDVLQRTTREEPEFSQVDGPPDSQSFFRDLSPSDASSGQDRPRKRARRA
eukprot:TRINITY_DN2218_c0_g1_i1.p1 TRINITY_DN2218_c0_g1~~TRINITY_DN2218_c0_g1_i1.p1  ORF type:complete len:395 (+),score=44.26 TRINITY_DN2218_c0_g1_i1:191-1375(+)